MAEPSTVILVPVLGRPHRVAPLMESVERSTPERHRLLFVANVDDHDELAALRDAGADVLTVTGRGTYPEKINAGTRETDDPLLFLAADDITPHAGWLTAAQDRLDSVVRVVGTNDMGNARTVSGEHSTHTLVVRSYVDEFGGAWGEPGNVLHEGYRHWYCDDELVGVARARKVWAHATDSIVEHHHPFHGTAPMDATYRKGSQHKSSDARTYRRRVRLWT